MGSECLYSMFIAEHGGAEARCGLANRRCSDRDLMVAKRDVDRRSEIFQEIEFRQWNRPMPCQHVASNGYDVRPHVIQESNRSGEPGMRGAEPNV